MEHLDKVLLPYLPLCGNLLILHLQVTLLANTLKPFTYRPKINKPEDRERSCIGRTYLALALSGY